MHCTIFHDLLRIFAALQVLFNIFLWTWGVKWVRLWNSGYKFEFSVFNLKWFFWFFLEMVAFTMLLRRWKRNVVLTLSNVVHVNVEIRKVDSTLSNVVNSNVKIQNVVSTLAWHCSTPWRRINQKTTLKQRWNVCWVGHYILLSQIA